MMLRRISGKLKFWLFGFRIGPDMPLSHFLLFSKKLGNYLASHKLRYFGSGAEIRPSSYLIETKNISIGKNVVVRPGSMLFAVPDVNGKGDIIIEDNVLMGSGVHIYVSNHRFDNQDIDIYYQGHSEPKPVVVKQGAWIGANVILLPGVTVGRNAVVGAGSVVTKSVDDFDVVAGSPAKSIKRYIAS